MQDGTALAGKTCARCYQPLNGSIVYRDHALWHAHCWQEGEHLLANATRIARAVTPPLVVPERLPPDSPLRIVYPTISRAHGCCFLSRKIGLVLRTLERRPGREDTVIFRTHEERMEAKCTVCGILLDVPCMVPGCPGHRNESVGDLCAYCAANDRQEVPFLRDVVPSIFSTLGDFEPDLDEA